jgi:uncharacterized protein (DUF1697 family)
VTKGKRSEGQGSRRVTYVALLRGINVGRAKPVAMSELRSAVESAGFEGVRTLLRSGNVVFVGPRQDDATVARTLEKAIESGLAMNVGVVVRTADELASVVEANLLPEAASAGAFLHVMFLATPLTPGERRALDPELFLPDEVRVAEREVYVWYRNGMSGSRTAIELGRRIKTLATDRNWNTVTKLLALTREE